MLTFYDLVNHAFSYLGKDVKSAPDAKRAVLSAYREVANMREWSYYTRTFRTNTNARQTTGTITYDHTGGAFERLVTLAGGTWPAWAALGYLVINDIKYDIAAYIDATRIQLAEQSNPGADVAALTTYSIERDTYTLPLDFRSVKMLSFADGQTFPSFCEPGSWTEMTAHRRGTGRPMWYTVVADHNFLGRMALKFWTPPDAVYPIDMLYMARGRNLQIEKYETGKATVTAASAAVTGIGTTWNSRMVGSTIRFGESTAQTPTGYDGMFPYIDERIVIAVPTATSLTLDEVSSQAFTEVKYIISDPADIEQGAMETLLLREIERQCRNIFRMKATPEEGPSHRQAVIMAFEADSRYSGPGRAGGGWGVSRRLSDMPTEMGM